MAKTFQLSVVTPEGSVVDADATSAVFPAYDGEYGVLPGHAPLLCLVGIGELRVSTEGEDRRSTTRSWYVDGGFAEVSDDKMIILTEEAVPVAELSVKEAEKLLEQARNMTVTGPDEQAHREATYARGRVQKRLARQVMATKGMP